ncbi:MAG: hypothetical protein OZ924_18980 [Burkholderiaceae bacterium]|nr:hypothetical protein [Burkholderiaceae bacterium]
MKGFWIAGIAVNVAALVALAWWAIRNWKTPRHGEGHDGRHDQRR